MKYRQTRITARQRQNVAAASMGIPPIEPPQVAAAMPPRDPSLTEKFNRASKGPHLVKPGTRIVTKLQIEALRRKMSQPKPTLEYGAMGSVTRSYQPQRDRLIMQTITALTEQLHSRKGINDKFSLAANKGEAKRQFNQGSQGIGR